MRIFKLLRNYNYWLIIFSSLEKELAKSTEPQSTQLPLKNEFGPDALNFRSSLQKSQKEVMTVKLQSFFAEGKEVSYLQIY